MRGVRNILLCGVGGQGVILAGDVIAQAALLSGFDVKKSEIHGMAQRGGSVSSHIRFGDRVYSPVIPFGEANILLSFEEVETVRYFEFLRGDGIAIVNLQRIVPMTAMYGDIPYPERPLEIVRNTTRQIIEIPGLEIAASLSNNVVNMVMVGALSKFLPFSEEIWLKAIEEKLKKKFLEINIEAFNRGKGYIASNRDRGYSSLES